MRDASPGAARCLCQSSRNRSSLLDRRNGRAAASFRGYGSLHSCRLLHDQRRASCRACRERGLIAGESGNEAVEIRYRLQTPAAADETARVVKRAGKELACKQPVLLVRPWEPQRASLLCCECKAAIIGRITD